jgi:hypothetical protein
VISMLRGLTAAAIVSVLTVSAVSAQHVEIEDRGPGGNVLRIGRNYNLKQGDSVREVVVISNGATIEGVVYQNVVVVLGTVTIARTAVIEGSLAVIGGSATIQPGAKIGQDLVVVAGSLDAPREFQAGGQHIVIGTAGLGERVRGLVPWLTEGLLLGRLIVPRLEWVWVVLAVIFLMSLVVTLVLKEAIRNCADAIAKRPLGTFLMGLLVLLLIGPVSVILAASVIGIAVLPFLFCALVIAWIIGKIAVKVRIGDSIMGPQAIGSRSDLIRSFVVGFAVVGLAYMVPVLGIIVWAVVGVSGLGAATTAFTGAYRREKKGAVPKVPPPPPCRRATAARRRSAAGRRVRRARSDGLGTLRRTWRRYAFRSAATHQCSGNGRWSRSRSALACRVPARRLRRTRRRAHPRHRAGPDGQRHVRLEPRGSRRAGAAARVPHRLLDVAWRDRRRDGVPPPRRAGRRQAARVRRCAGARAGRLVLTRRRWHRLPVDPARSRTPGVA